ncbi:MAG: sigma 54-interacting transcriptional regulator [Gemmatimonadetes bacterium]|nr:sigma 54-interacting transcriptional regulator [Gemmatimonadota bacterium]
MSDISFEHVLSSQYTVFDGLGGMHIEDLYQDRQGFLWIATADGGVSRFDSARFDTFGLKDGLPNLTVMAIAEDADGRLLFGTFGGGLAVYDGRGFQVYTTEHGLPSNEIVGLQVQPDKSILVLTGAGVAWFAEGRCIKSITDMGGQPLGRVYDMAIDAAGTTWLATLDWGIISLDGRRMDIGARVLQEPWNFAQDPSGHLWISFRYTGSEVLIGRYNPQNEQFTLINVAIGAEGGVKNHGTRHVRADERGWLWLSRRGVVVYDGQAWYPFSASLSDIDFSDTRLTYEDREGNIWIGLWGGGLIFCDPASIRRYMEADGLPDHEVRCLGEDHEGRMWIGTMDGMACMEEEQVRPVETGEIVSAMVVDGKGQVWSGGSAGKVYKWEGQTPQVIPVAEETHPGEISGLCEDGQGRIWVGTFRGRFGCIEENRFTPFNEWLIDEFRDLLQDQNGVFWIGFYGSIPALYCYEDGHLRPAEMAEAESIAYVNVLWKHQNTLWVGTAKGLFALDLASREVRHFTAEQFGLSANGILALTADPQGNIWMGTSGGGVLRYDGQTFQSIRLGPSALENMVEAVLCDRRGRLWFGTREGLVAYQPGHTPPCLVIREVMADTRLAAPEAVSCPESTPEIRVHFQGISFRTGAGQMRYSHRLVGHDPTEQWSEFTAADAVAYNALPVGEYCFEVRAMDRDGLLSEVASVEIQVLSDAKTERIHALEKALRATDHVVHSKSWAMRQVMEQIVRVAETAMTVLVLGETGTGKGLIAHTIHETSARRKRPFIQVNCGALPVGLVESELFGHEKGAFTGANTRQLGRFELADGGTLFLDEIGDLPLEAQRVLLNILEENALTRVGGQQPVRVDVRVIAATNRDLRQAMEQGTFREDLFYRLSVFTLELPPLRQRQEDVPALAAHFAERYAQHLQRPVPTLDEGVVAHLQAYTWPGNVRELEHVIHRAVLLCKDGVMRVEDASLPSVAPPAGEGERPLAERRTEDADEATPPAEAVDEKQQILKALQATHWRVSGVHGAAALLGMHPEKLRYRMQKYGLRRPKP